MDQHQDSQTANKRIDIEAMRARISSTPPPEKKLTRRDAIEALKPELVEALANGHTPTSLSAVLRTDGLKVGARTLASWLNVSAASASKARSRKPSRASAA
ncbi:MAG: hypothetical protein ABI702_03585 [Burkholderiales bacterium]